MAAPDHSGGFTTARLAVAVESVPGGTVVAVDGEIDIASVGDVRRALEACGPGDRILDLRAVGFLDTSALRLFVEQQRAAELAGRRFVIANVSPHVERLLEISGLRDRLELVERAGDDRPAD